MTRITKIDVGVIEQRLDRLETIDEAFAPVDPKDWDYLFSCLGDGGHGQFWKNVFFKARVALTPE